MPETVTDIVIDAPAEHVWDILTDFSTYPDWNPLIRQASGDVAPGAHLTVTMAGSDGSEHTAHPTVVHLRPGRELRWRDRPGLPGLMDTESNFKIEPLGPERVRFVHWQKTSGLLAPFLGGGHDSRLRDRLRTMDVALKEQAERGLAPSSGQSLGFSGRTVRPDENPAISI
jgi:hypothetical protein